MTPQEKLIKIEAVIRELKIEAVIRECCPELQELTFGCQIHRKGVNVREMFAGSFGDEYSITRIGAAGAFLPITIPKPPESQEFEIICHPIHLEHILRAIEEKEHNKHTMLTITGYIMNYHDDYPAENTGIKYDLTLPLHLQSDEFISWLYGVLVGE